MRLSIVASHPVQYQAPLYRALAAAPKMEVLVHYAFLPDAKAQGAGFGVPFSWDIPLLDGYRHEVFGADEARSPGGWIRSAQSLLRSFRSFRPDAILCTGWHHPAMYAGLAAAVLSGCPKLLRCEANILRPRRLPARLFHRSMLVLYDAFLPIGSANRAYYRRFGVREDKLIDAPYFIDNKRFTEMAGGADRAGLRRRWGIPADAFCFLFSGKLEEKKHPLDIVEAMSGLAGAHLLVAGSGELEKILRQRAADLGVGCSFAGFLNQSEIPLAYAAADCLVLPSDAGETWGLVVNESMACGRPAIVSDRVGCRQDLVQENITGLSFRFGDVPALARRMRELASDPERSQKMGAHARQRVFGSYSVEVAAAGVLQALRQVVPHANHG